MDRGIVWNALGSTMFGANSFLMLALVGRIGSVEEAGCFSIAFTTAQLIYIIGLFGMNDYQQTDYQEKYPFCVYAKAKVPACGFMVIGCIMSIYLLDFTGKKVVYFGFLTIFMMLHAVGELFQALFFQKNRLDLSGQALFHRTFWPLSAFGITAWLTESIVWSLGIQIVVNLAVTCYYALHYMPQMVHSEKWNRHGITEVKALLSECFPLFVSVLLMNLTQNGAKYGIEIFQNDTAQGYFNMIFMPAYVINLCSQFLFKPLLKQYSELLIENKKKELLNRLKKQVGLVMAFTLFSCIAAFLFGTQVLGMVYNKDLSMLKKELFCVILGGGIFAVCQIFYYLFVLLRFQNKILFIYSFAILASLVITGMFIIHGGIAGAALSFVFTQSVVLGCYVMFFKVYVGEKRC